MQRRAGVAGELAHPFLHLAPRVLVRDMRQQRREGLARLRRASGAGQASMQRRPGVAGELAHPFLHLAPRVLVRDMRQQRRERLARLRRHLEALP